MRKTRLQNSSNQKNNQRKKQQHLQREQEVLVQNNGANLDVCNQHTSPPKHAMHASKCKLQFARLPDIQIDMQITRTIIVPLCLRRVAMNKQMMQVLYPHKICP